VTNIKLCVHIALAVLSHSDGRTGRWLLSQTMHHLASLDV